MKETKPNYPSKTRQDGNDITAKERSWIYPSNLARWVETGTWLEKVRSSFLAIETTIRRSPRKLLAPKGRNRVPTTPQIQWRACQVISVHFKFFMRSSRGTNEVRLTFNYVSKQHACFRVRQYARHEISGRFTHLCLDCRVYRGSEAPSSHSPDSASLPVSAILASLYLADRIHVERRLTLRQSPALSIPRP